MPHYSHTPLSQVALGITLAVIISGETSLRGSIAPDISPKHFAAGVGPWLSIGQAIARQLLNTAR